MRKFMLVRLGFLAVLIVAVFVVHVSGTALVIMHVVRIALVALAVVLGGWRRSRRSRAADHPEP